MTATLDDVTKRKTTEPTAEARAAEELVRAARERGLSLTCPEGLLKQLTKTVLETALNEELAEHLGTTSTACRRAGTCGTGRGRRRCVGRARAAIPVLQGRS